MKNDNFFELKDFLSIKKAISNAQTKKTKINKSYGARKIGVASKGTSGSLKMSHINESATQAFLKISSKSSLKIDLESIRDTFGMTQKELGEILGVSHSTIQKIEQNDVLENNRDTKMKLIELDSLYKYLKKKFSKAHLLKAIFKTESKNFNNLSVVRFSEQIPKNERIYEISGRLRRQFR